jgi:tetratricopeptide (TPR) repeat protein
MRMDERIEQAEAHYEHAVFTGDTGGLAAAERGLDAAEADLALARGRIRHVRFFAEQEEDPHELELFERALELYRRVGDIRGEAEALFWIGAFHQVVRADVGSAVPAFERSYELATRAGDKKTQSEALRHLGIADHSAGRLDEARKRLEESSRLRQDIGLLPGVAANLVGLIYIAIAEGRRDDALTLVEEARGIAEAGGADRILGQVEEAGAQIPPAEGPDSS